MKAARRNAYDEVIADRKKAAEKEKEAAARERKQQKLHLQREIMATRKLVKDRPDLQSYLAGLEKILEKLG